MPLKLSQIKPRTISVTAEELVRRSFLEHAPTLPLVLTPASSDVDLAAWAAANKPYLETELLKVGAILFRGFNISAPAEFDRFVSSICSSLFNENGEHPRESMGGNIYTPVFYAPDKKLLWHNENSFNAQWPMKIWFYCHKPAAKGGETTIADSRLVFQRLSPAIRDRFLEKKVMYVRNYREGLGLDWETVFQTRDPQEVERQCRAAGFDFEWTTDGHLRTTCVRPAAARHPQTGEMVWFNQAQHWHPAVLDDSTRESLKTLFDERDLPRNCHYGDGSLIEDSVMHEICSVYQDLEVAFPWRAGDIMMLDNMLVAHARNPFVGERKLCVALGEMMSPGV